MGDYTITVNFSNRTPAQSKVIRQTIQGLLSPIENCWIVSSQYNETVE